MIPSRRAPLPLLLAGLLAAAGCGGTSTKANPKITFFGADDGTITTGGTVVLTWKTENAEKVRVVATPVATGKAKVVATFASGDTTGCQVNPAFPKSDCVKDGTLGLSPTGDTVYNLEAVTGAGDCTRDPTTGALKHPSQCADLTNDPNASLQTILVRVVPPAVVKLTVGGQATATVAPGTDVTADYQVTGATRFGFGVLGTDASGKTTYTACGEAGDTSAPCTLPARNADGSLPATGQVTVPAIQATTKLTGQATNGADDGLGDVLPGKAGATVQIVVPGTPAVGSFTAAPTTVPPSTAGTKVTLTWTVTAADTVAATLESSSTGTVSGLAGCTAVDGSGKGTCDVTVAGSDGDQVSIDLVASNSQTGQTSPPATATVGVLAAPAPTLTASPADIASGGDVTLTWTAPGATSVTLGDGTTTLVDTGASPPTQCGAGAALHDCKAAGDTFTVSNVTATTTWTLTATNATGQGTATATTTVHTLGATITGITVDGHDALGSSPVTVAADTATLAFTTTDAASGSLVVAPAASAATPYDCTTVAATTWAAPSAFDFATGTFGLTGITRDMCYQLSVTGFGSLGGDSRIFEVRRQVKVGTVSVNGTDITAAHSATLTAATPPAKTPAQIDVTASYATASWAMYVLKSPAAPCDTATYGASPDQSGAMTAGAASYTIPDVTGATCVKITVAHPADGTRTDTYFLSITVN